MSFSNEDLDKLDNICHCPNVNENEVTMKGMIPIHNLCHGVIKLEFITKEKKKRKKKE